LAGEYYQQTGDLDFIKSIWANIEDALNWIDCYGDRDGDGFIEYESQNEKGLSQQGWKDSDDSVFHEDGRPAHGAIALCEVQGYVYDAWIRASQFYQLFGHSDKANQYQKKADTLKKRFNEVFWCDDIGTYALALDGDKTPCRVRSSNAGHTLFSGIAYENHARQVAKTLLTDDSFSGWGIRTIARSEKRYNPMSYHNGAVWPHDNAIIAMGFARYSLHQETEKLLNGHFEASMFLDLGRMPELFCGFVKRDGEGPTLYPLACAPQAWASTVIFAMLKACLQMRVEHNDCPQLLFCRPHLPAWLDHLKITSLRVGTGSVDIMVQRYETDVGINVLRREGNVKVTVVK
jgi:glycogen debranching enzyme